jgi:hypothetical protein
MEEAGPYGLDVMSVPSTEAWNQWKLEAWLL